MIVTVLFVLLALLAVAGAGGALFLRRPLHGALSCTLCTAALAGLYLLLGSPFLAAVQLAAVFMAGVLRVGAALVFGPRLPERRLRWPLLAGAALLGIAAWGIAAAAVTAGRIGAPILRSVPMWAVQEEHVRAFGRELLANHWVVWDLLGVLLLTGIVAAAYLARQGRTGRGEG